MPGSTSTDGLDGTFSDTGTTNVDVNPPLRSALARVLRGAPLRLSVGDDELVVDTLAGRIVERKVDLPDRWVKGFAETQVAQSRMVPVLELSSTDAQRLLRSMPTTSREPIRIEAHGSSWRLAARPVGRSRHLGRRSAASGGAAAAAVDPRVAGVPIARRHGAGCIGVGVHGRCRPTHAHDQPRAIRGFSGEGGLLGSLADTDDGTEPAVDDVFMSRPLWTIDELATDLGSDSGHVGAAVDALAVSGRVGYDLHRGAYFQRVLPLGTRAHEVLNPRLRSAAALLAADAVTFDESGLRATVVSGDHHHVVNLIDASVVGARCTCTWYAKHRGGRGPCKHVLAAVRVARPATP